MQAVPDDARRLTVRRLPRSTSTDLPEFCSAERALAAIGPSCKLLPIVPIDHTGTGEPSRAFDADVCTEWNAGAHAPQAIRAEAADDTPITGLLLVPEMTPNGNATHVITLDDDTFVAEASFSTVLAHFVVFEKPMRARSIAVHTVASPSWVAWRAIRPFACEKSVTPQAAVVVRPDTLPPPGGSPGYRVLTVPGQGACRTPADCAPVVCCGAGACSAKSLAPACNTLDCTPSSGFLGCECVKGRCAGRIKYREDVAP